MITKSFLDGRLQGREGRGMGIASRMIVRWHGPANGAEPPQGIGPHGGARSSHPVAGRKHPCESFSFTPSRLYFCFSCCL